MQQPKPLREKGVRSRRLRSKREGRQCAISRLPQGAEGHVVDLSNEEMVRAFFSQIGEFDHLVFTAGEFLHIDNLSTIDM